MRVVLGAVQDAENDQVLPGDTEKDFIGEAAGENAAKIAIVEWKSFGVGLQTLKCFCEVDEKLIAQTGALFFIPLVCLMEIRLCPGTDGGDPLHRRDWRR